MTELVVANSRLEKLEKELKKYFPEVIFTSSLDDIKQIESIDSVRILGGDGTINGTLNRLSILEKNILNEINVIIHPAGTGNDIARTLGINYNLQDALKSNLFEYFLNPNTVNEQDYLTAYYNQKSRHIFNFLGMGLDTLSIKIYEKMRNMPLPSSIKYPLAAAISMYQLNGNKNEIKIDDKPEINPIMILITNLKYFGRGMPINLNGELNDGHFEVATLNKGSYFKLLKSLISLNLGNTQYENPLVKYFEKRNEISLKLNKEMLFQIDGELIEKMNEMTIKYNNRIKYLVP